MSQLQRLFSWQSPEFQAASTANYRLRCVVKTGYFAFAILSSEGKILVIRELHGSLELNEKGFLESVMMLEKDLKAKYAQVEFLSIRPNFQLIPAIVFNDETVNQYLQLAGGNPGGEDEAIVNRLSDPDAFLLFPAFKTLREKITFYFEGIVYRHIGESLISCLRAFAETKNNGILAHLQEKTLFLLSINGGNIRLTNAYEVRETDDIAYYIQLVARMSDLGSNYALWLSGQFDPEGLPLKHIKKLLPQTSLPVDFYRSRFASGAEKVPAWKYAFFSF